MHSLPSTSCRLLLKAGSTSRAYPPSLASFCTARFRRHVPKMNVVERAAAAAHAALSNDYNPNLVETGPEQPFAKRAEAADGVDMPQKKQKKRMGMLQKVPSVSPSDEHLASAVKRSSRVDYMANIKNDAARERNKAARQMDTLMKELSVPLTRYLNGFPALSKLHPFERTLLQLTVGETIYESILIKVHGLRKSIQEVGKGYASRASKASNKQAALLIAAEGVEGIIQSYTLGARHVDKLKEVAKKLRALPHVELRDPTLALVGAPNVGKSSLVQILSSGTPEIQSYPFTTRSIKVGHFFLDGKRHQVTDTPGVLARSDETRNKMELLTLAALDCLPTSVLFVMDLTEECGTSIQDQWEIREELLARFPTKPWLDVFSKSDMLEDVFAAGDALIQENNVAAQSPSHIVADAAAIAAAAGGTVAAAVGAAAAAEAEALFELGENKYQFAPQFKPVASPEDLVARIPYAIRCSSLSDDGIPDLQQKIIAMFTEAAANEAMNAASVAASSGFDVSEDAEEHGEEGGFRL